LPGFLLVNLLATVPKSAALLAIGGFAGASLPLVERHVVSATIVLAAAGLMATLMVLRRAHPAAGAGR
jgi:hypothetical protein